MSGQRRVLDLSSGAYVPPQQRPVHRQQPQQSVQQLPLQRLPTVAQQQPSLQNILYQGLPTVTQTGLGPFESARRMQETMIQQQQITHTPVQQPHVPQPQHHIPTQPSVPTPQRVGESAHANDESRVMVNGCDVTGCKTIAEAYEKNKNKMKLLIP